VAELVQRWPGQLVKNIQVGLQPANNPSRGIEGRAEPTYAAKWLQWASGTLKHLLSSIALSTLRLSPASLSSSPQCLDPEPP